MKHWKERLTEDLEGVLKLPDPWPAISAYHDMPYAIFRYTAPRTSSSRPATDQRFMGTRLEHVGKRVTKISLAECMVLTHLGAELASARETLSPRLRRSVGLESTIETIHQVLERVSDHWTTWSLRESPGDADPLHCDVVLDRACRCAFPNLPHVIPIGAAQGQGTYVPAVLFYPGELGRSRWTALHGRAGCRAQLPAQDLLEGNCDDCQRRSRDLFANDISQPNRRGHQGRSGRRTDHSR